MSTLEASLRLADHVAVRPEPFGALAYHYDTRKLIFLRHPDVVRVVHALREHPTVADALRACEIAEERWPSFMSAIDSLAASGLLVEPEDA